MEPILSPHLLTVSIGDDQDEQVPGVVSNEGQLMLTDLSLPSTGNGPLERVSLQAPFFSA